MVGGATDSLYSTLALTDEVSVKKLFLQSFSCDPSSFSFCNLCRFLPPAYKPVNVRIFITRGSEMVMFSPCVFVCVCLSVCLCLSRCLSGRFNYERREPHKQYFASTLSGMFSCASYVSRTHDVIDNVTRSQSRSNFEIDISPPIFELERRSKAQNVGNGHGYLSSMFNFRYNFR